MHEIRLWGPDGSHRRSNQTNHSGASLQSLDTIRITTGLLPKTNVHSQLSLALASAQYGKGAGRLASLLFLEVCMSLALSLDLFSLCVLFLLPVSVCQSVCLQECKHG